ncbi:MAG: hypothetical protein CL677_01450 [Bdellovibrionaceae bacterium]|nr:hypothetical protein [Pseudobdellovibrionaceae bacterium]|tara:strand:- start:145506 stop:146252 length:747 start_codon:yes stop_codon:yes gene_type:complete
MILFRVFLFLAICICCLTSFAAPATPLKLGIALSFHEDVYVNNRASNGDFTLTPAPLIFWKKDRITLRGLEGLYTFFPDNTLFDVGFSAQFKGFSYRSSSVQERLPGVYAGPWMRVLLLHLSTLYDVLGKDAGQLTELYLIYKFPVLEKKWILIPKIGYREFNKKYIDYFFGVSPHEAVVYPAYQPSRAGSSTFFTLINSIQINESYRIDIEITKRKYSSVAENSPLVDRANPLSGTIGLVFNADVLF